MPTTKITLKKMTIVSSKTVLTILLLKIFKHVGPETVKQHGITKVNVQEKHRAKTSFSIYCFVLFLDSDCMIE